MNALEKVTRVLVEEMHVDASEVEPTVRLRKLGFDSLEMSQLMLELEDEFGIVIPDDDMQQIFTVEDAANYAEKRLTQ